ncbi:hypothetical protein PUR71_08205 [Streptomyces sp. SP17BM10]|uniref:hypothetical protein n=1 Tax=Streptomyces sp. SP17BM10 TaxID=3002530 RepID=UPI002E79A1AB|nr:hypothetical protein [Streptomyces sp. SP17BM10]MEE1782897.1 hypothetical protein [Streptomyces sp. SP17BM10]
MSRTARTTPRHLRVREGMAESVSLRDLRYSTAELSDAAREGRRPAPTATRRRIITWEYLALDYRTASFPTWIAAAEAGARLRGRLDAQRIRGLHRAGHSVDGADIPPVRHRRGLRWLLL